MALISKRFEEKREEEQLRELDDRRFRMIERDVDRFELQRTIRIEDANKKNVVDIGNVAGKKFLIKPSSGDVIREA